MNHDRAAQWGSFAIMLVAGALLGGLAFAVSVGAPQSLDTQLSLAVHRWASPLLTVLARWISTLGSIPFLCALFAIAVGGFRLARWRGAASRLALVMIGAIALDNGMKYAFHRVRPEPYFGVAPASYSFPSGHALFSACFYFTVAIILVQRIQNRLAKTVIATATAVLVSAIGLSRIYLGVHFPTDVLGGYLTAIAWLAAVVSLERLRNTMRLKQ